MRAVIITRPGGPEVLELREVPEPVPDSTEILVRVRASALNRADLLQREGRYPPPPDAPADIPGIEFAGEVEAVGARVQLWRPGQRVYGIAGGGAHAELLVAHERAVAEVPAAMEWVEAGATPEAFITAHDALVTQAAVRPGERVLIHAVGSGVGLAAAQLARALGAVPYGTARTPDKVDRAREYGLEDGAALPQGVEPLADHVRRWTGGRGVEVVLDLVGGPYTEASVAALAPRGRLILIGTVAGARSGLDLRTVLSRRLTIRGTVLRARPLEEKIAATRLFAAEVGPLLSSRAVRPVLDSHFPLAEIRRAHERLGSNATFGKVGLKI
jgi:NADPH:quinone reductase